MAFGNQHQEGQQPYEKHLVGHKSFHADSLKYVFALH